MTFIKLCSFFSSPARRAFVCIMHGQRNPFGGGCECQPTKCTFFVVVCVVGLALFSTKPAASQQQSLVNTPPILVVPERNWRIAETEQVGQVIARIHAEDAENDELVYGLEPHFLAGVNSPFGKGARLPFRIDPVGGVVYLNESLVGRGGENFFLYITVSDGQLTAKIEVFVNILSSSDKNGTFHATPSISNVVQNISQFLPAFHRLPGVQSIRNQQPNRRPSNNLPPGFGLSGIYPQPVLNYNPSQQLPLWPNEKHEVDEGLTTDSETTTTAMTLTTKRTKLTPIMADGTTPSSLSSDQKFSTTVAKTTHPSIPVDASIATSNSSFSSPTDSTLYVLRSAVIPIVVVTCGLFVAAAVVIGFLYRKRLCAFSKTLKTKSKEEMAKKSNQSNLSSNLTDDSRNSMVMQHWNGPMAYGNRYVPWERDQQLMTQPIATSQLSTSAANGATNNLPSQAAGVVGGPPTGPGGATEILSSSAAGGNGQDGYDRWEFPRHRLKFFNILGEGAFGQVWRCEATDIDGNEGVTTVAVKTLKESATEVEKKDLFSELEVMKSLEPHVNVVRLLGCCTDKDPIFMIIEYVNRGKLQTYLRNSRAERHYGNTHGKSNILTSSDLTSFMYQVAKGMDYLTSRGIIHRDLAARNILITDEHTCKVADFGFARDVVTSKIYERKSEGKLPIRWMAVESLYDNIFSVKSDIWSFGILMWEIVTLGSTPYPGISASDVMRKVRDGYRLEKPEHCRRELYNIMYYCWSEDANERPAFSEIVQMLDKLLHTEMDYIELERFPDHNYYNIVHISGEKV